MTHLFQQGDFTLHSGRKSWFKIDCDALTEDDWKTLARLIAERHSFRSVVGIPTGGLELAVALQPYCELDVNLPVLIVDDVLTTGNSMNAVADTLKTNVVGVVIFSRTKDYPFWITPILEGKL